MYLDPHGTVRAIAHVLEFVEAVSSKMSFEVFEIIVLLSAYKAQAPV
jgi:hypothetical protein